MRNLKETALSRHGIKVFVGDPGYVLDGYDYKCAVIDSFNNVGRKPQDESIVGYIEGEPVTEYINGFGGDGEYVGTDKKTYGVDTGILGATVFNPEVNKENDEDYDYNEETLNQLGTVLDIPEDVDLVETNVQLYEGNVSITVLFDGKVVYDVDIKVDVEDEDTYNSHYDDINYDSDDEGPDYIEYEDGYRDYQDDYVDEEGNTRHTW